MMDDRMLSVVFFRIQSGGCGVYLLVSGARRWYRPVAWAP
jgi:hypothetical protein